MAYESWNCLLKITVFFLYVFSFILAGVVENVFFLHIEIIRDMIHLLPNMC